MADFVILQEKSGKSTRSSKDPLLDLEKRCPKVGFKRKMSRDTRKPTFWFPTWSDTNQAVQLQKMARGLKFRIYKVEGLYYLFGENKGADKLHVYREADQPLYFCI